MYKTAHVNGLAIGYLEQGPADGPLVVCVHGFPDTAHTFRPTLEVLAEAGFRAVAMSLRGYPPSEAPADGDYGPLTIGADIIGLIDALGADKGVVVGHDWGAMAAYSATAQAPERVDKLVTLAIPHPLSIKPSLKLLWKARHFLTFQRKKRTVAAFRNNDHAFVDAIYRRWSPTWDFDPSETAEMKRVFAQPGAIEGALGYYWSFATHSRGAAKKAVDAVLKNKIPCPTLAFAGEDDGALDMRAFEASRRAYSGSYEWVSVPNTGHFVHREAPDFFHERLLSFLRS